MASSTNKPIRSRQFLMNRPTRRVTQDFLLVWLDTELNFLDQGCHHALEQLHGIVDDVYTFTQPDDCVDFMTDIEDRLIFLIVSRTLGEQLMPDIHSINELKNIYVFSDGLILQDEWVKGWPKIKGIYCQIESLSAIIQKAIQQNHRDCTPVSYVPLNDDGYSINLNQLDPSFMYTQLLKRALLTMEHDDESLNYLMTHWRHQYADNPTQLKLIDDFERDCRPNKEIWWYTRECFAYEMLNRALRLLEGDIIADMGVFLCALHQQIEHLQQEQHHRFQGKPFIVYRGQGLSTADFEKLTKSQGGLMSFNSFLSTSKNMEVSLMLCESAATKQDTVGILYVMTIDPDLPSTPFADIQNVSYYEEEGEILFSMHTIFRIGQVKTMVGLSRFAEVQLTLTTDADQQLQALTTRFEIEAQGWTGWERVGNFLSNAGQPKKAEEIYMALIAVTTNLDDEALYSHQLGSIKQQKGDYNEAVRCYEHAIDIKERCQLVNDISLASSYNDIALVYDNMGEYSKALSYHEKALDIRQTNLPENHPDMANSYSNIGLVYDHMDLCSKALYYSEKALDLYQRALPDNHPSLATSCNNIGTVYYKMKEYSQALLYYKRGLAIQQKTLPTNHPSLAVSYNNIGLGYANMQEQMKALPYYEKACEIFEKTFSKVHPALASSVNNIGLVYVSMGEYSKALLYYEKACKIFEETLPPNHPDLVTVYNNMGSAYQKMEEEMKALVFYEKVLRIRQMNLPANHLDLAESYDNVGAVYNRIGEYMNALPNYEKALHICQAALPETHLDLATLHSSLAVVYFNIGEYSKALFSLERAMHIGQSSLPPDHPDLLLVCEKIEIVKQHL